MEPEERVASLGLTLPAPPPAVGAYVPWAITRDRLLMTSFRLPWRDGRLAYEGRLGAGLSVSRATRPRGSAR
jgi:hypothetical protein